MFGSVMSCSPDGKFLVSLGSGGPGRVWDLTSSTVTPKITPKEKRYPFSSKGNYIFTPKIRHTISVIYLENKICLYVNCI